MKSWKQWDSYTGRIEDIVSDPGFEGVENVREAQNAVTAFVWYSVAFDLDLGKPVWIDEDVCAFIDHDGTLVIVWNANMSNRDLTGAV